MYACMFVLYLGGQLRFLGSNHQPCALTFTQITWETQRALGNIGDPVWLVTEVTTMCGPGSIAKLVYNSNNYGLWYL